MSLGETPLPYDERLRAAREASEKARLDLAAWLASNRELEARFHAFLEEAQEFAVQAGKELLPVGRELLLAFLQAQVNEWKS